jgi:hypothetical protein
MYKNGLCNGSHGNPHSLFRAFGWEPPEFAHLPLIMNSDGTKLSKRQNDLHLSALRDRGILAPALLNFVTLVGGGFQAVLRIYGFIADRDTAFFTSIRIRIQTMPKNRQLFLLSLVSHIYHDRIPYSLVKSSFLKIVVIKVSTYSFLKRSTKGAVPYQYW